MKRKEGKGVKDQQGNNMKKKVIAIGFSDLHHHNWKQFNEGGKRLELGKEVMKQVSKLCTYYRVPAIFAGDIFHSDEAISNSVFDSFVKGYLDSFEYPNIPVYAIDGNHDQEMGNCYDEQSISYGKSLNRIFTTYNSINYGYAKTGEFIICGIPYNNGDIDLIPFIDKFKKIKNKKDLPKILVLHTNLPGAKDPSGYMVEKSQNIPAYKQFSKDFLCILSGHIHKFQKLYDNVYMIGAPYHQRRSDLGCKMGITKIYNDGTVKLVELGLPEYKYIPLKRTKAPDNYHYWIQLEDSDDDYISDNDEELLEFKPNNNPINMGKEYLKKNGITQKSKKRALLKSLK